MDQQPQEIAVDTQRVLAALVRIMVVIVAIGIAVSLVRVNVGWEVDPNDFGARFELHREQSLPTWFSALLLASSAPMLCLIAVQRRHTGARERFRWWGLAALVTIFSLDEVVSFHEYTSVIIDVEVFGFFGAYNWVVFGMAFVTILVVTYAPFVAKLEPVLRNRLLLAAAVYFGGALGVEMLNADLASSGGEAGYRYALQTALEESMEMAGAVILLHALLDHLLQPGYRLVVRSVVTDHEPLEPCRDA